MFASMDWLCMSGDAERSNGGVVFEGDGERGGRGVYILGIACDVEGKDCERELPGGPTLS